MSSRWTILEYENYIASRKASTIRRGETRAWEGQGVKGEAAPEAESKFMARVVALAKAQGYRVYHPYRSDRSTPGWFDLAMARAGDKLVLAELKKTGGKQTEAQRDWFEDLLRIERVETYLWVPKDYEAIVDILTAKTRLP